MIIGGGTAAAGGGGGGKMGQNWCKNDAPECFYIPFLSLFPPLITTYYNHHSSPVVLVFPHDVLSPVGVCRSIRFAAARKDL